MVSPSASDALIDPIDNWFSSEVNDPDEVIVGELSFKFKIDTVISIVDVLLPSDAKSVAVMVAE